MGERKRGQVIIIFILALSVLLGFVALGIDVGYMYSVRNDLQRSVDSGALAGAFAFHDGGWPVPASLHPKAENRAKYFATRDPVGAAPLGNGAITVDFPAGNQIHVRADNNVTLFFAGVIGKPSMALYAEATAEAIPVDQNVECLTPLAFPYPYTDTNGDGGWDPGEPFLPVNQGAQVTFQVADTPSSTGSKVNYVMNGQLDNGVLRGGAGEIFPITMCGDSNTGQFDLRLRIFTPCHDGCNAISFPATVSLKGNTTYEPTIDEIWVKFLSPFTGDDPSASWGGGASNLPISPDPRYSGDNWLFSPRVMRVMLYNPATAQASGNITVDRFAGFWVDNVAQTPPAILWPNNASVSGYLIPDSAVGGQSVSPPNGPVLKTTRLVQ